MNSDWLWATGEDWQAAREVHQETGGLRQAGYWHRTACKLERTG